MAQTNLINWASRLVHQVFRHPSLGNSAVVTLSLVYSYWLSWRRYVIEESPLTALDAILLILLILLTVFTVSMWWAYFTRDRGPTA